jgi:hypothetical protein
LGSRPPYEPVTTVERQCHRGCRSRRRRRRYVRDRYGWGVYCGKGSSSQVGLKPRSSEPPVHTVETN